MHARSLINRGYVSHLVSSPSVGIARLWAWIFVAILSLVVDVRATEISYDNGYLGVAYSAAWGNYFGVRFTTGTANDWSATAVSIRGDSMIVGSLTVYVWDNNSGKPKLALVTLTGQYLSSSTWNPYDVSNTGIVVPGGSDVFAGLHPITCQIPYDSSSGARRSWWMPLRIQARLPGLLRQGFMGAVCPQVASK